MSFEEKRNSLVKDLKERGYLQNEEVIKAMKKVPRHLFVPTHLRKKSYLDQPLPIGKEQTISAPHMVGILVEALKLSGKEKVLEVGTGSGYNAAVIAEVLKEGKLISIEKIESLAKKAKETLKEAGYEKKVKVIVGDGSKGYSPEAPYDRIYLTAGAPEIPSALEKQLKNGGIILAPVGGKRNQSLVIGKKENKEIRYKEKMRCAFVPLKGKHGF